MEDREIAAALRQKLGIRSPNLLTGDSVLKRAAVAAILRMAGERLEVLLIRRAEREGDLWSGHMAFPGGRADPGDRDLTATVVRETQEEIGIDLATHADLLGRLDDLPAIGRGLPTGMVISPFVFMLSDGATPEVVIRDEEVAEVIWTPVQPILRGELATTYELKYQGETRQMPAFDVGGRVVWGLTWRMMTALFELL
jgi:8-oxo-dGTP pyrophosphatase MutT (NUDIX family)